MKTAPVRPAAIAFDGDAPPVSRDYGDLYHPRIGALAQARHVFLGGSQLPQRWRGRACFAILETGFGLGHNFLATLTAWLADPAQSRRLIYVAIERHPPSRDDLARAHHASPPNPLVGRLVEAWPALVPSMHLLPFADGRVTLLLAFGDVVQWLPQIRARIDAFFLDGFAPACNPEMWQARIIKGLARLAAPGATVATWSAASAMRAHLRSAGFEVHQASGIGGKRDITLGRFAPRFQGRVVSPASAPCAPASVLIIGAGLAGAWTANALAQRGVQVTVIDAHAVPAAEASGNLAGIYHATVHADDGPHAQLLRAAALWAHKRMRPMIAGGLVPGQAEGVLRIDARGDAQRHMRELLERHALPRDYLQALDRNEAAARAGVPLSHAAWWFADAGWVAPAALATQLLRAPGVQFAGGMTAQRLQRDGDLWIATDGSGQELGRAPVVVLANAAAVNQLVGGLGLVGWPLQSFRGQVSIASSSAPLRLPVAGDGYALPLSASTLLCGGSSHEDDGETALRDSDHSFNLDRLQRLTGLHASKLEFAGQGRVGWRVQVADRQPICGPVPAARIASTQRMDHARFVPRAPGMFVATALGGRGITLAPLLGELLAAQICGEPLPLGADLVDAIDPARWLVRLARRPQA